MERKEIKKKVVEQLINMLYNDFVLGNGTEPFTGWLAEGEVFELNGHNEEEVKDLMDFANTIAPQVDNLIYQIETQGELLPEVEEEAV